MDLDKMTLKEARTQLQLLADWGREQMKLLIQERRETERKGGCFEADPGHVSGLLGLIAVYSGKYGFQIIETKHSLSSIS
jgi:hypothetical protein